MSSNVGTLIYTGVMPLVKMYITMFFGFMITRRGLFSKDAAKGASYIAMNIALPALIFSSIVPAFTPQNISAIGPLAVVAVIYVAIGTLFGYLIREVCYVPRNFWQGIIVATALSNWTNLPSAIVLSVTSQSPFNPATDPNLGISFVSIFICIYQILFWVAGAAASLAWDYEPGVPQGEDAERRVSWKEKPIGRFIATTLYRYKPSLKSSAVQIVEKRPDDSRDLSAAGNSTTLLPESSVAVCEDENMLERQSSVPSTRCPSADEAQVPVMCQPREQMCAEAPPLPTRRYRTLLGTVGRKLLSIVTPITVTIAIAIPIALIQPLKALFVDTSAAGGPSWKGPDGRPPLYFILDTARFIGGIMVPMALMLLGASFARLKIPRPISRLPIPAMISVCLVKMAVLPVVGVLMVNSMDQRGFISRNTKTEVFVAMFMSGSPSALNQFIASSLFSPTGDLDTLSAFFLAQYTFMFFSSAALTAVSLHLV